MTIRKNTNLYVEIILYTILKGLIIGLLVSAPMGPIGVLCIQRTLNRGRIPGLLTGIGASFSDIFYALLTGLGMSMVINFIEDNEILLQIFGSVVLAIFGYFIYKQRPSRVVKQSNPSNNNHTQDFFTAFLLTLSNPLIIFLFIGLFARLNFIPADADKIIYIIGYSSIFCGALIWWFTITYFVNKLRFKFNSTSLWILNRCIGGFIIILSVVGFFSGIIELS